MSEKYVNEYWKDRQAESLAKYRKQGIYRAEKQIKKYYKTASEHCIGSFLNTYRHILNMVNDGKEPTPADLYKLDSYWQAQATIKKELELLGDKQTVAYLDNFKRTWKTIYNNVALKDGGNFNKIDDGVIEQMIKGVWCADGKTWSERVWTNTDKLKAVLNEELINCVLIGADEKNLRERLMYEFKVSYSNADMIIKTEMAHIQTQATNERYKGAGVKEVEVWADEDERRCELCGKLHEKRYKVWETMPIPVHPRCRCCILPVLEDE